MYSKGNRERTWPARRERGPTHLLPSTCLPGGIYDIVGADPDVIIIPFTTVPDTSHAWQSTLVITCGVLVASHTSALFFCTIPATFARGGFNGDH